MGNGLRMHICQNAERPPPPSEISDAASSSMLLKNNCSIRTRNWGGGAVNLQRQKQKSK